MKNKKESLNQMNEKQFTPQEKKLFLINEVDTLIFRVKTINQLLGDTLCNNDDLIERNTFEKLILLYNLIDEKLEEAYNKIEEVIKELDL